jgi:hypothetical protein
LDKIIKFNNMNKNYKHCDKGHFYAASFSNCPHCQNQSDTGHSAGYGSNSDSGDTDKTALMGNAQTHASSSPPPNAGQASGGFADTVKVGSHGSGNDDGRTVVVSSGKKIDDKGEVPKSSPARKLVGWLVSYTINDLGIDFRLYEGQNNIGRDTKNIVRITEDPAISSHHATILFRGGQFYLRDEMSTNPSFVNGEEVMPGNTVKLKDGDSIMVGKTVLLLRYAMLS